MIIQDPLPDFTKLSAYSPLNFHIGLCEQIKIICSPLFEFLSLDSFTYSRIHNTGEFIYVSSHKDWLNIFHDNELYNSFEFQKDYFYLNTYDEEGTFLYMGNPNENEFMSQLYNSSIWNCLTLFLKKQNETECWTFSSTPKETKVLNLYLNKPDIFKHFSTYFNREFYGLIKSLDQSIYSKLTFCQSMIPQSIKSDKLNIQPFEIQKYYLSGELDAVYLSKRETECLFYLSKGNTIKQIGKSLSISPRTVEVYIENAKMKTQLKSKIELLDLLEQEGIKGAIPYSRVQTLL